MTQTTFLTQQLKSNLQNTTGRKWTVEEASGGFKSFVCGSDWTLTISRNGADAEWTVSLLSRKAETGVPIEEREATDNEQLIQVTESMVEDLNI